MESFTNYNQYLQWISKYKEIRPMTKEEFSVYLELLGRLGSTGGIVGVSGK